MMAKQITQKDISYFRENGYVKIQQIATQQQLATFRQIMIQTVKKLSKQGDKQGRIDDYSSIFTQVTNIWQIQPKSQQFVLNKQFGQIAKQLLGVNKVRLYHDQALVKPSLGKKTPWHQDAYYWPLNTTKAVTMWIPMHKCPRQMGTMNFVKGSHLAQIEMRPISQDSDNYFQSLIKEKKYEIQGFNLQLGDATFHYSRTLHCANQNTKINQNRQVMTIIYFADETIILPENELNEFKKVDLQVFCPGIKPLQLANSKLNPIIC